MRQLLLLRHAKSTWDDASMPDKDRPLNARGRRSAAIMRKAMLELGLVPDVVLVSTARRTLETLEALEPWDDMPLIEPMDSLYLATPLQLGAAVHGVAETVRSVLLIGHNPGLHDFAVSLAGPQTMAGGSEPAGALAAGFPTGALAEFVVAGSWWDLREGGGRLVRFLTPRMLEGIRPILMDFELAAHAEAVAGLGRLQALAACRDGKPRSQAVKIVWHDSPEHALFGQGQSLAEQRGAWRLERVVPGDETWLPGQPPPLVADAPDLTALPPLLTPLAAFDGRRTVSVHRFGDNPVTLTVEKGILRAVTAERAVARILLAGEEAAVRAAALLIAESIPAAVPLASLAAEAIALATGRAETQRQRGAPTLPESLVDVPAALAYIVGHLTDVILAYAPLATALDAAGTEAVHQMRVAVRRARSALSTFRSAVEPGALDTVNDRLQVLGRRLGPSRDWDVFADETMPAIQQALTGDPRVERLAAAAFRRRRGHRAELGAYLASAEFRLLGIELAWFAAAESWRARPAEAPASLAAFSATVLQHRWKKLVSSGKHLEELDIPELHDVRLRAKRARYAAEMFATLYHGKTAHRFISRLSDLQQRLGVLNDGAVAMHLLEELGGAGGRHAYATGVVAGFIAARAGKIRPRIVLAFEKFRRQAVYWM